MEVFVTMKRTAASNVLAEMDMVDFFAIKKVPFDHLLFYVD